MGAMTSIDTVGPILAGLFLYREPYPRSWEAFVLLVGLTLALGGARAIAVKHRLRR